MEGIGRHRVGVRQQAVTQLVVPHQAVEHLGALRREIEDFAERKLAMRTEQRRECAELEPAQVELAPLLEIRSRGFCRAVAPFVGEAADVEGPVGQARIAHAHARGNLVVEIVPARRDVAAPHRGGMTLQAREARAREDEYALVGAHRARTFINAAGVHQRIGVEELLRRTHRRRADARLDGIDVEIGVQVGLGGIHPPRVDAQHIQILVELAPVDVARGLRIRIVERVQV